jgi:hypothetical protein
MRQSIEALEKLAGKEAEVEAQKQEYRRLLRKQDQDDAKKAAAEHLALVEESFNQEKALYEKSLADNLKATAANPFKNSGLFTASELSEKEAEMERLKEMLAEKVELRLKDVESEAERIRLINELQEGQAAIEQQYLDYKKQMFQQYTETTLGYLQPYIKVTQSIFDKVTANITNEKKVWDGVPGAIKASVGSILKEQAKLWIAKAGEQTAAAIASLAILDFRGAGLHGLAAGGYLAAAALAGYAGAKLTPKEEQKGSEPGSASNRPGSNQPSEASFQTKELAPVVVYLTGPGGTLVIPTSDPRALADFADGIIKPAVEAANARQGI